MIRVSSSQSKRRACGGALSSGNIANSAEGSGLQMRQSPLDDHWVFNASNDLDLPGATFAGLNVDPDAAQLNTRFSRCIQVIDWWRSAGVLSSQFSPVG